MPLSKLDTPMIRERRSVVLAAGVAESVAAKAYRLLRAILMAVREDEILRANRCRAGRLASYLTCLRWCVGG
jgi:hypothetical protein